MGSGLCPKHILQFIPNFFLFLYRHFLIVFNRGALNYLQTLLGCAIIWDRDRLSHCVYSKIIVSLHEAIVGKSINLWCHQPELKLELGQSQVSLCCICFHSKTAIMILLFDKVFLVNTYKVIFFVYLIRVLLLILIKWFLSLSKDPAAEQCFRTTRKCSFSFWKILIIIL